MHTILMGLWLQENQVQQKGSAVPRKMMTGLEIRMDGAKDGVTRTEMSGYQLVTAARHTVDLTGMYKLLVEIM